MKSPAWRQFEKEVLRALELAGFSVDYDSLVEAAQTDIVAQQRVGGILTRLIVECKFSEDNRPVPIDQVENFIARVITLRNQDKADHGYLVSNKAGFTRNARAAASQTFVELLTLNELRRRIFNFEPYARSLIEKFKNSPLSGAFVRPRMAKMALNPSQEEGGITSIIGRIAGEKIDIDMIDFCTQWIHEPKGGQLCLLGDNGVGKTTFCAGLVSWQAERYLESPDSERIPILISLSRYARSSDVKVMMTDILVNECGISNPRLLFSFETMLRDGLFLVIVDGFDEMARQVDREVRYRTICDLAWLSQGESKIILTGRPSYFPTHEELAQVLGASFATDEYEAARGALEELVQYALYEMQPFSEDQIKEFLGNVAGGHGGVSRIWSQIRSAYGLTELAAIPMFLNMIVKSLPKLTSAGDNRSINAAKLYDIYTEKWISLDGRKGHSPALIKDEIKLRFMEELAIQLFLEGVDSISPVHLNGQIKEFFKIDEDEVEFFSHEIRTCTFLKRASKTAYEFIHRSFWEFFIARRLIFDAARGVKSSWALSGMPPEALHFAGELLADSREAIGDQILEWCQEDPLSQVGRNCLFVIRSSGLKMPEVKSFEGISGTESRLKDVEELNVFDVVLFYDRRDWGEVRKIVRQLRERGIRPWVESWNRRSGRHSQSAPASLFNHVASILIFIGPDGDRRRFGDLEHEIAIKGSQDLALIPVILPTIHKDKAAEIPDFLKYFAYVDFRESDPDPLAKLFFGITGKNPYIGDD